ncbi:ATP-binding protein [Thaumasiovibrio subtropicus]|nr:ATP-binding protein [Thaumasiovibrio subtropicus]
MRAITMIKEASVYHSISSKFGLTLLVVFIIVSSILGVLNYSESEKELEKQVEAKMDAALSRLSLGLGKLLYNIYSDQVYQIIVSEMNDEELHTILIKDASGSYVTHGRSRNDDWQLRNINKDLIDGDDELYYKEVEIYFNPIGSNNADDNELMGYAKVYTTKKFLRDKLTDLVISTIVESILLFTVLYFAIYMILMMVVINPLQKLKMSSDELAKGNLSFDIDIGRKDEIGSLADSFVIMRDSIRKKISDLDTLNTTGEALSEIIASNNRQQSTLSIVTIVKRVLLEYLDLETCDVFIRDENDKQVYRENGELAPADPLLVESIESQQVAVDKRRTEARCCMPMLHDGNVIAVFDVRGKPESFDYDSIGNEFISTLFRMGSTAVLRVMMLDDIQRLNQDLEKRVKERTEELSIAQIQSEEARKKAEISKDEAERANQAKSQFLSNMSHELRTPLNAVLGFSEMLKAQMQDSKSMSYLMAISSAGNTLLALINSVLDLAKIESGKMELEYRPTSLRQLVNELHSFFYQQASERDILFDVQISDDLEDGVLLDTLKMKQVLINLCSNAVKFTRDGSVTVAVRTANSSSDARVDIYIDITDTGKGIPKSQQERIFQAFEQMAGQKSSEYGGTGLGLAITLEIVHLMGGTINVFSEGENKGARFSIAIPDVEKCHADAIETITESHTATSEQVYFEFAKILVVDDIAYNRNLISSYLSDWDFDILEAENGQDALEKVHEFNPDLILTDLKMPVIDGHELCAKLRDELGTDCMPLVMVTASALVEEQKKLLKVCNEILTKPLAKQTLVQSLTQYLEHSIVEIKPDHLSQGDGIDVQALNFQSIPEEILIELIALIEIGDTKQAVELCHTLPDELSNESQWITDMLDDFELEKLLVKLKLSDDLVS